MRTFWGKLRESHPMKSEDEVVRGRIRTQSIGVSCDCRCTIFPWLVYFVHNIALVTSFCVYTAFLSIYKKWSSFYEGHKQRNQIWPNFATLAKNYKSLGK